MINYDSGAQEIIRSRPAPYPKITLDVVEYPDREGIVVLRLYANDIFNFSDAKMLSIFEWITGLCDELNSLPLLAKYTWECVAFEQR